MRSKIVIVVALVFCIPIAHAGVIYGTIKVNGRPLSDTAVTITCNGADAPYRGVTNASGSYSIKVEKQGRCTLRINHAEQDHESPVYSQTKAARHDFKLHQGADNEWALVSQ